MNPRYLSWRGCHWKLELNPAVLCAICYILSEMCGSSWCCVTELGWQSSVLHATLHAVPGCHFCTVGVQGCHFCHIFNLNIFNQVVTLGAIRWKNISLSWVAFNSFELNGAQAEENDLQTPLYSYCALAGLRVEHWPARQGRAVSVLPPSPPQRWQRTSRQTVNSPLWFCNLDVC